MYKLKISPKAKGDLAEIKDYISQELYSPKAAIDQASGGYYCNLQKMMNLNRLR